MNFPFHLPVAVLTDSYKATHHLMYPKADVFVAYGEFRQGFAKDTTDTRFIAYGIRYIIEHYISIKWTLQDVEQAEKFFNTHNAGFKPFPFPKDLFIKFINENAGYFPVVIQALPEGTVANVHTPVFQITAEAEYSRLVTFLETMLTQLWYPCTVATLSRRAKDIIGRAFEKSVDDDMKGLLDTKLHDFGFRGCTSMEQSIIGCCAHLLNFVGTDTMSGAYYAQFHLNNGEPCATSIPASEHSVMTSYINEKDAIDNMIDQFGGENQFYSVVMDSYDYKRALYEILPQVQLHHIGKGGHIVLRPDSGDPVEAVLMGLDAANKVFGSTTNSKGYKVVKNCSVIQGDGITIDTISKILDAVLAKGYSAQCVTFGMGAGLLQKVNRDVMSFATKLSLTVNKLDDKTQKDVECEVEKINNKVGYEANGYFVRPVMKLPATDSGKISLPGKLRVVRGDGGLLVKPDFNVFPSESEEAKVDHNTDDLDNQLVVVYNKGPVPGIWDGEDFTTIRARVEEQWARTLPTFNPISQELQQEIDRWSHLYRSNYKE